jgi:hypothetical protein
MNSKDRAKVFAEARVRAMLPRLDRLLQKQRQKSTSRVSDPIVSPIVAITAPTKTNAAGAARGGRRLYGKRSPGNGIFRERQRGFVGPASSDHDDRLLEDAESYDLHALGASGADAASIEIPIDLDVHHHVRRNTCLGGFRPAISNFIRQDTDRSTFSATHRSLQGVPCAYPRLPYRGALAALNGPLLEEWLIKDIVWNDPAAFRKVVIQPLREIRSLRQTPARTFTPDAFSGDYYKKRKGCLWSIFNSLSNIRGTFAKHPSATHIKIPEWLDEGSIDVF